MSNPLSAEELSIIAEEEAILRTVLFALQLQQADQTRRLTVETARARTLTHELVASRKFEEKVSLGDQERLSHALKDRSQEEVERLYALLSKPYFARLIIREETAKGNVEREFKIGHHPNSDCRIVDWKRAPISKLYYHYKEGEEFAEEIQGVDRFGTVAMRRQVEIEKGVLRKIICPQVTLVSSDTGWRRAEDDNSSASALNSATSRLPDVLSYISADQFDAITREATGPVLIQGIAGSGKTTVALYRSAWLFNELSDELSQDNSAIVVLNPLLRSYISNSLEKLSLPRMKVHTFPEWTAHSLGLPNLAKAAGIASGSPALQRLKADVRLLRRLEQVIISHQFGELCSSESFLEEACLLIQKALIAPFKRDEGRGRTAEFSEKTVDEARSYYSTLSADDFDRHDLNLALWIKLEASRIGTYTGTHPRRYDVLIADEAQDLNAVELSCIALAARDPRGLTLVGDSSQQTESESELPGWPFVQELVRKPGEADTPLIKLTVPYRCTLPIMQFAAACRGDKIPAEGRSGPRPLWVRCRREEIGHAHIIQWLTEALRVHPGSLCSVLCASRDEARVAASMLKPAFGNLVELADPCAFTIDEGILVSDIAQAKGLEFSSVLLWNPSKKKLPDSPLSANLLYVAATRAQDELCVISWDQPSPRLPGFQSPLVDAYTTDSDEPAERQPDDYR
jgi:DNA helicase IV